MTNERFFNLMNEIDDELLLREAKAGKKPAKKAHWLRWGTLAACLALVAALGFAWYGDHAVTLDGGDTLRFGRGGAVGAACADFDGLFGCDVQSRILTQEETAVLIDDYRFEGWGFFNGETGALLGVEGKINDTVSLQVSSGPMWSDCIVWDGMEQTSVVNGVPVTAGYSTVGHVDDLGVVYYATFQLGSNTVYVENGGRWRDRKAFREELTDVIEALIADGEVDLTGVQY